MKKLLASFLATLGAALVAHGALAELNVTDGTIDITWTASPYQPTPRPINGRSSASTTMLVGRSEKSRASPTTPHAFVVGFHAETSPSANRPAAYAVPSAASAALTTSDVSPLPSASQRERDGLQVAMFCEATPPARAKRPAARRLPVAASIAVATPEPSTT